MAKKEREYKKLPGVKKGFMLGRYTLWQGKDHLLYIYSRFGVEDYKRFYYADVQALVARKTAIGKIQNAVLLGFAVLFALPALASTGAVALFFATAAAVMLFFLAYNIFKGPTCETHVLTAVQTERLYSLHRLKQTCAVMDALQPCIKQAQGELGTDDLKKATSRQVRRPGRQALPGAAGLVHEKGSAHRILFFLLLLNGAIEIPGFWINHVSLPIAGSMILLAAGIFVIIALVRQNGSDLPRPLQAVTWASLGFVGGCMAAGYIFSMALVFKNPQIGYNQWTLWKSIAGISLQENPLMLGLDIFMLCGSILLGLSGLLLLKKTAAVVNSTPPAADSTSQSMPEPSKRALSV